MTSVDSTPLDPAAWTPARDPGAVARVTKYLRAFGLDAPHAAREADRLVGRSENADDAVAFAIDETERWIDILAEADDGAGRRSRGVFAVRASSHVARRPDDFLAPPDAPSLAPLFVGAADLAPAGAPLPVRKQRLPDVATVFSAGFWQSIPARVRSALSAAVHGFAGR